MPGRNTPSNLTHAVGCRRQTFPGISIHVQEQAVVLTVYDIKILLLGSKVIGICLVCIFEICYWNGKEHMQGFATHIVSFPCSSSFSSTLQGFTKHKMPQMPVANPSPKCHFSNSYIDEESLYKIF